MQRGFLTLLSGRRHHVLLQAADVRAGAAGHEVAEVLGDLAVACGVDPADAWMVGDGQYDVEAGRAAELRKVQASISENCR